MGRDSDGIRVSAASVMYDVIGSDHVPLTFKLAVEVNVNTTIAQSDLGNVDSHEYVNWDRLTINEIKDIEEKALDIMGSYLKTKVAFCSRLACQNNDHRLEIDGLADLFFHSIHLASGFVMREMPNK